MGDFSIGYAGAARTRSHRQGERPVAAGPAAGVRRSALLAAGLLALVFAPPAPAAAEDLPALARALAAKLEKGPIAVLPFEVTGGPKTEGRRLAEELTHELVNRTRLTVVERNNIDRVYREQSLVESGLVGSDQAARVGRLLAVKGIIVGSLDCRRRPSRLNARLVDPENGRILAAARAQVDCQQGTSATPPDGASTGPVRPQATASPARPPATTSSATSDTGAGTSEAAASTGESHTIPAGEEATGRVEQFQHYRHGNSLHFLGLVRNTGKVPLKSPMPTISLLDAAGNQLQAVICTSPRTVFPGEASPFRCIQLKAPKFARLKIHYTPEEAVYNSYVRALKAENLRFHRRNSGLNSFELTGILKNSSDKRLEYAQVIVLFFAGKNRFVGSANGFAAGRHLQAGASAPFKVLAPAYQLNGQPTRYELMYSALDR